MSITARRLRPSGESAPTGRADDGPSGCDLSERGTRDEVPAHDLRQPGEVVQHPGRGLSARDRQARRLQQEVHGDRGTARRVRPGRRHRREAGDAQGRGPGRQRRPLPGDEGVHGLLLPRRCRERGAGLRARRGDAVGGPESDRGLADPARVRKRRLRRRAEPVTDEVRRRVEDLLRELAPQVLGTLTGRYGQFDACEDATQEALLKAAQHWPEDGIPQSPRGWLLTVASRVLIDESRSDNSRRRREDAVFAATPQSELLGRPADSIADPDEAADRDDSLKLLFLCCHPSLSVPSQIALTLRAVGGLTTAQIAAAFLVPEATMAQR